MAIKQTIECCVCGSKEFEKSAGDGFPGWGAIQGIELDGEENPTLCPEHLTRVAKFLDGYKQHKQLGKENT